MRDGENAVYEFEADEARLFLRVTPESHRSRGQLEAELDFIDFVASCGVAAARAVASDRGERIETVQADDAATWHAIAFAAAPGRHFRYYSADIGRPLFHAWGMSMGALHAASRDFVAVASRRRPSWSEQDTTRCDPSGLSGAEVEARREHARVTEWLASLRATPESWGMIHGDFERTNFVLDEGTVRLFDFDDACHHWYVADIAHALWAFRGAPPSDRERFLEWFLEGYRQRCPVEVDVREQLSWFVRLRSLSLFLRHRARAVGGESTADDRWERRMRAGFDEPFSW